VSNNVIDSVAPYVNRSNSSVTGWLEDVELLFYDGTWLSHNIWQTLAKAGCWSKK